MLGLCSLLSVSLICWACGSLLSVGLICWACGSLLSVVCRSDIIIIMFGSCGLFVFA